LDPLASEDALPLPAGARVEVVEPFIEAVALTLREMASADVVVQAVYDKKQHRTLGDVSAVLALAFPGEGRLVLSFPSATATALARRVLADVTDDPEPALVGDCVGELANVIAGQAKALLLGSRYHFTLSTPTVLIGAGREIRHPDGAHCLVVAFSSDLGEFALELSVTLGDPE
jgi:chemotaxis protein CheX